MIPLCEWVSSFVHLSFGTWTYAIDPMILRCARLGLTPYQGLYGVVGTAVVELQFLRYTTVSTRSIHSPLSSLDSAMIALTLSIIVRFALSATLFWSGL